MAAFEADLDVDLAKIVSNRIFSFARLDVLPPPPTRAVDDVDEDAVAVVVVSFVLEWL